MLGTARDETAPLFGRAREERLLASLSDEVATRGQALVIRGDPGIGKSRLLAEAASEARERGMAVLTATGVQSEAHLPFAGLHQLLRPVRERAVELPPIQREALDAAFGLTDEVTPEPYRIAMAALDLVSEVAAARQVLLVVDEAHCLDRPTADVLAFVARRIESDPVLLLAAARDGYPGGLADAGLSEHRLTGLDDAIAMLREIERPDLNPVERAQPPPCSRGPRRPHGAGASDRPARGRGPVESRDRPAAVPVTPHDQRAPVPGVPEARDHVSG